MALNLTSPAFEYGKEIPVVHTCDGDDVSPQLMWDKGPKMTVTYALIMEDPDAPGGTFTHWIMYNIPPDTISLDEVVPVEKKLKSGAIQGKNDFGKYGYRGPCPPAGENHRYYFRIYAVNKKLDPEVGTTREGLLNAIKDRVLDEGEYMGTYIRK
ncbi:MAG: YbhB/YbcL family Raf kinase inhibitor-like protein [Bacteroidales bacterium]|nr:YbhB/YbcL family Raf kinase inhibitor-like protein [Bacteroidales bacterium]